MPQMGESVTEGTVLEWHKQEGDTVSADETLVEMSTDKVDAEVPAPVSGTIVKMHAAEGETVEVGALLAEIAILDGAAPATGGGDPAAEGARDRGTSPRPPRPRPAPPRQPGETIDIVMPASGESVTEGTILEWSPKVGDTVADGDTIVEISTDKVDMPSFPPRGRHDHRDPRRRRATRSPSARSIARIEHGARRPPATARRLRPPAARRASAPPTCRPAATPDGAKALPGRRRVAAAEGVDLAGVRHRPGRADPQGRRARRRERQRARRPAAAPGSDHDPAQGRAPRCSPATWTSRARSRRRPRSARSP